MTHTEAIDLIEQLEKIARQIDDDFFILHRNDWMKWDAKLCAYCQVNGLVLADRKPDMSSRMNGMERHGFTEIEVGSFSQNCPASFQGKVVLTPEWNWRMDVMKQRIRMIDEALGPKEAEELSAAQTSEGQPVAGRNAAKAAPRKGNRRHSESHDVKRRAKANLYEIILKEKKPGVGPKKLAISLRSRKDYCDLAAEAGIERITEQTIEAAIEANRRLATKSPRTTK